MTDQTGPRQVQSVSRACEILAYLKENGACHLTRIAEDLDQTPGTVHTYLSTLRTAGFVQKEQQKYNLGLAFVPYSKRIKGQTPLYKAGKNETDRLAHKYDAVSHLTKEFDGQIVTLHEISGEEAVGKKLHTEKQERPWFRIHCTAAGKAILAHLPEERVNSILTQRDLPAYTSHTITDPEELLEDLQAIRDRGYSVNDQESMYGNRGFAAPILLDSGTLVGAISISGPANSWKDELFTDELPEAVMRSANNIEINLSTESRSRTGGQFTG